MMVLYNADVTIEYDRRRSGLPSAPIDAEYDNNSIEQWSSKHRLSILFHHVPAGLKDLSLLFEGEVVVGVLGIDVLLVPVCYL